MWYRVYICNNNYVIVLVLTYMYNECNNNKNVLIQFYLNMNNYNN